MFKLNYEQELIVSKAIEWYYSLNSEQVFQFDGPPGSGKSVVLNEIIKRLNLDPVTDVAAMSYIGSASLVMRTKGLLSAKTAHSWLYECIEKPMRDKDGNIVMDDLYNAPVMTYKLVPRESLGSSIKIIVIDEAYTMPLSMKKDILKFGIKVIACGDQFQLPPVGDDPAFLVDGKCYHLTKVMRQDGKSDIISITDMVRNNDKPLNGIYPNSLVINKEDLTDGMLLWADIIICCRNDTRDMINKRKRQLLGYTSDLPQYGERVVCRKNNWIEGVSYNGGEINLTNGLIGTVINNPDISTMTNNLYTMYFQPDLADVVIQTRCNYDYTISDYAERNIIRNSKYTVGNLFEFAYAITTHVSQGGQWHNVVYIEEPMRKNIQTALNVVGASRSDNMLVYVKSY